MAVYVAAFAPPYRSFCGCDATACTAPGLEAMRNEMGPLCCNADFYSGPLSYDCTGVTTVTFEDMLFSDDGARLRRLMKGKASTRLRALQAQSSSGTYYYYSTEELKDRFHDNMCSFKCIEGQTGPFSVKGFCSGAEDLEAATNALCLPRSECEALCSDLGPA